MCTNLTSEMDVRAYVPKIAAWLNTLMRMAMAVSMAGWYPDPEYASSHACWDVHVYALSNWTMDTLNWSATWMLPMFLQPLKIYAVLTLKIDFIKCVRRAQKKNKQPGRWWFPFPVFQCFVFRLNLWSLSIVKRILLFVVVVC